MSMAMQCPSYIDDRAEVYDVIRAIDDVFISNLLEEQHDLLHVMMGKHPEYILFESLLKL